MDQNQYSEMLDRLNEYESYGYLSQGAIFVFGHCEASLTVIDEVLSRGYKVQGIYDNSKEKQGIEYRGIPVIHPNFANAQNYNVESTTVLLATRFYEQMNKQLRNLGFVGKIIKLVDYNTYSEYSLSDETINRKIERVKHGKKVLQRLKQKYQGSIFVFCPFNALGDIYYCLSYLPAFISKRKYSSYVLCVLSKQCEEVGNLFGAKNVERLPQYDLDAAIQATLYTRDENVFIAHQDRPYIINLHKALKIRRISLENIYKIGIFSLNADTVPVTPYNWVDYSELEVIPCGKTAILSPYAKSVTAISDDIWADIIENLKNEKYQIYTNVFGNEKPLPDTIPISPRICEMKSVVERAGLFIGIRSGLCDILRTANCSKLVFFPDYLYGDTRWKAEEMYELPEFLSISVDKNYKWPGLNTYL